MLVPDWSEGDLGRGAGIWLLNVADIGPELGDRLFESSKNCDGGGGFFGDSVSFVESGDFFGGIKGVLNLGCQFADDDQSLAIPIAGSPQPEFVVTPNDFEVWFGLIEKPNGRRFAVVHTEDGCSGSFFFGDGEPDFAGGGGHLGPSEHISMALEGRFFTAFGGGHFHFGF